MVRSLRAALVLAVLAQPVCADDVVVFAAASLKTALDRIVTGWGTETGHRAVVSYGGSPALARQIEQGAPADIFLSASPEWMDRLADQGLIRDGTRADLLGNRLVLIAHGRGAPPVDLAADDLAALLGDDRLAMAMVDSVPAGVYGKQALTSLGQWDRVAAAVAQAENVRAALALVATGEAPFGIVYASDAVADDGVTVVATFPATSHDPITYPVALTAASVNPAAQALLDYLSGPAAVSEFEAQGFRIIR